MDKKLSKAEIAELCKSNSAGGVSPNMNNLILKNELLQRGFYVNEIKKGDAIEYLVVSTAPPVNESPIDHNAN